MTRDDIFNLRKIKCRTPWSLLLPILIFGCSTYRGEKLGIHDNKPVAATGVPYTLVRPEYTLTRTPPAAGEKKPTYTLGVSYEADPTHRYTLRIEPGIFADPNFVLKLGA